ncbi:MAG: hypothetical protein WC943_13700 [Elusimicrobiota bacterium]
MRIATVALTALLAAPTAAAGPGLELPSMEQVRESLEQKAVEDGRVWLRVTPRPDNGFTLEDAFLRLRLKADPHDDWFLIRGAAGGEDISLRLEPVFPGRHAHSIKGSGVELLLKDLPNPEQGNRDYSLKGTVVEAGVQRAVGLTFAKRLDWQRYEITDDAGTGSVRLILDSRSGWELSGRIDMKVFGRKSLACLAAASVAVIQREITKEKALFEGQAKALEEVLKRPVPNRFPPVRSHDAARPQAPVKVEQRAAAPLAPAPSAVPCLPPAVPAGQAGLCPHGCPQTVVNVHVQNSGGPCWWGYPPHLPLRPGRIIGWREFQRQHRSRQLPRRRR